MERDVGVWTDAFFAGAERSEIFGGFGNDIGEEFDYDSTLEFTADAYVEVHSWVRHFRKRGKKGEREMKMKSEVEWSEVKLCLLFKS